MKEVLILIPEGVDTRDIFYMRCDTLGDIRFVKPLVARYRSDISEEDYNKHIKAMHGSTTMPIAPMSPPSRKEFEALCIRVQRLELLTTGYQPSAEEGLRIVGCSDKEIEEIRSRVEKLERESERQCARVIKMQESVSDDLK